MDYIRINDIVKFQDLEILTGIILGEEGEYYHLKGNNGKTYFKLRSEIIESVGRVRVNEARKNAEEWEKGKCKYPD